MSRLLQNRWLRISSAALVTLAMAGCGAKLPAPALAEAAAVAQADAQSTAQVNTLITQYEMIQGDDPTSYAERIHIYNVLGASNSDKATAFLLNELDNNWVTWPDDMEDALEPALLAALNQLAASDVANAAEDAQNAAEGKGGGKKKSTGRRFNIWTGLDKFFGVKKGHRGGGGGGKPKGGDGGGDPPPAAAPDPASGGDGAPAPAGGPDPGAGGAAAPANPFGGS